MRCNLASLHAILAFRTGRWLAVALVPGLIALGCSDPPLPAPAGVVLDAGSDLGNPRFGDGKGFETKGDAAGQGPDSSLRVTDGVDADPDADPAIDSQVADAEPDVPADAEEPFDVQPDSGPDLADADWDLLDPPDKGVVLDVAPAPDGAPAPDAAKDADTAPAGPSCAGKCGDYEFTQPCQCDEGCVEAGDCCKDYAAICKKGGDCAANKDCDDLDPCTADACTAGACSHTGNGSCCKTDADCDDASACTVDACTSAGCTHAKKACDDGLACTTDSCDAKTGACKPTTVAGACAIEGFCRIAGEPSAANPCLVCDPAKNAGGWTVKPGAPCDDGSSCTAKDACHASGSCVGETKPGCCKAEVDCAGGDPCVAATCDKAAGTCSFAAKAGCCSAGVCCDLGANAVKKAATVCGNGVVATDYACSGQVAQKREAYAGCDGKTATGCATDAASLSWTAWKTLQTCTSTQKCALKAGSAPTCEAGAPTSCTAASQCDDKSPCTDDACDLGKCAYLPKKCPDGPACEAGVCDAATGACKLVPKTGTCKIDSACVAEGTKKTGDPCLSCQPQKSTTAWSIVAGCACASGVCCDVAAGKLFPTGKTCGSDTKAIEYACSADGNSVESRVANQGCTGSSNACVASAAAYVWQAWKLQKACTGTETCEVTAKDLPGVCKTGGDPLCGQKDAYEAGTSYAAAHDMGTYDDTAAAKSLSPKILLGSATDLDVLRWTVTDAANLYSPVVGVAWIGSDKAMVCAYFACSKGAKGTDCAPVVCPAGSTVATAPEVSGVTGNGCCVTAASGAMSWTPKASAGSDASGTAWLRVSNASAKCQQVGVDLKFGIKQTTACSPGTTCCEADGNFSAKAKACGTAPLAAEYKCDGTAKGGKVLTRKAVAGCSGTAATCATTVDSYSWSDWTTAKVCASSEVCEVASGSQPGTCKTATVCTPGSTCCTTAGEWAAAGTRCGTFALKTEYQCTGAKAEVRKQFSGCVGGGANCSGALVWSPWFNYQTCVGTQTCLAGATSASPPTCGAAAAVNLCAKFDPYEGDDTMVHDLGIFGDNDPAILVDPKVHLKSVSDNDQFQLGIVDELNFNNPKVFVKWTAAKPVEVCAMYQCVYGGGGKACVPTVCPTGSTPISSPGVSSAKPNGCCLTAATGTLTWSPDAAGTTDETGILTISITNKDAACQEVGLTVAFGGSTDPQCNPATTCCAASGSWAPKGTACGATVKAEYQCSKGTAGGIVQVRKATGTCNGGGSTCGTATTVWGPWQTQVACTADEWCSAISTASAGTCKAITLGSCSNACGGKAKDGSCWCDAACAKNGDCCADIEAKCGGTCEGACGGKSKAGACYCDQFCASNGDCCLDKAQKCVQ